MSRRSLLATELGGDESQRDRTSSRPRGDVAFVPRLQQPLSSTSYEMSDVAPKPTQVLAIEERPACSDTATIKLDVGTEEVVSLFDQLGPTIVSAEGVRPGSSVAREALALTPPPPPRHRRSRALATGARWTTRSGCVCSGC